MTSASARLAERRAQILLGILAGCVVVAVFGLSNLWADADRAIVPATIGTPVRYNGIGGNPNTMAMLLALVVPLSSGRSSSRGTRGKVAAAAAFVLLDGSLVASGSRGAILGAFAGALVARPGARQPAAGRRGRRLRGSCSPSTRRSRRSRNRRTRIRSSTRTFGAREPLGPADAQFILPLETEIGFPGLGASRKQRRLFETSGRLTAWAGALEQAAERPVVGYGFGTEERVFVDRYYNFTAERVENSYVAHGAAARGRRRGAPARVPRSDRRSRRAARPQAGRHARRVTAAALGVFAAGLVLGGTQSFLTSVGSPATAPFWLATFLLGGATLATARAARAHRTS